MHLPRRLGTGNRPVPLIQLALDPASPRGARLGPNHHLWRNGRLWWIAYTLLHDGWRQERVRHSLGTADVTEARVRRDRILDHWEQAASAAPVPPARSDAQSADCLPSPAHGEPFSLAAQVHGIGVASRLDPAAHVVPDAFE